MSRKYKFHNESGAYFISFATVYWLDVFTRQVYFNVLEESIDYCKAEKGMEVFAYCFMPSHVHLIFRSSNEDYRRKPTRKQKRMATLDDGTSCKKEK